MGVLAEVRRTVLGVAHMWSNPVTTAQILFHLAILGESLAYMCEAGRPFLQAVT